MIETYGNMICSNCVKNLVVYHLYDVKRVSVIDTKHQNVAVNAECILILKNRKLVLCRE